MARIYKEWRNISRDEIASNSLAITSWDLVSMSGWFITKSGTTWEIIGISKTTKTFASNNQTVAKSKVSYLDKNSDWLFVEITASAASLSQADIWSYFNLTSAQLADYATKTTNWTYVNTSDVGSATDAVIKMQLQLVEILTTSKWVFKIM